MLYCIMSEYDDAMEYENINPSKRMSQRRFLSPMARNLMRYTNELTILCLPGIKGWDISYLLSLHKKGKINIKKIIGIERNLDVYTVLTNKFKNQIECGVIEINNVSTTEYINSTNENFDIIYLDYFSNWNSLLKLDIELIIKRKLIKSGGKLAITFYGSRESTHDSIRNDMDFNESTKIVYTEKFDLSEDQDSRRCQWVNSFYINMMEKYGVSLIKPSFSKYKTISCNMINTWVSIKSYDNPKRVYRNKIQVSPERWFNINIEKMETVFANNLYQEDIGNEEYKKHIKARIVKFHQENDRTPTYEEAGSPQFKQNGITIITWADFLRSMGLCPPSKSKIDDIIKELKLIEMRDGFVTNGSARTAKLYRKLLGKEKTTMPIFCNKHDIVYIGKDGRMSAKVLPIRDEILLNKYLSCLLNNRVGSFSSYRIAMLKNRYYSVFKLKRNRLKPVINLLENLIKENKQIKNYEKIKEQIASLYS